MLRKVFLPFVLFVVSAGLVAQTAHVSSIPLQAAMDSGKVTADFEGTGASSGDSIRVRIAKGPKAAPGPLQVNIPPGSMLGSGGGGYQSMVIAGVRGRDLGGGMFAATSRIVLNSRTAVTYILAAFCAQFEKDNPYPGASFSLSTPDPTLACILRQSRSLSVPARQAAVWIYTDNMTFERVNHKFAVTSADWSAAQDAVGRCRSAAENEIDNRSGIKPVQATASLSNGDQ